MSEINFIKLLLVILLLSTISVAQDVPIFLGEPTLVSDPGVPIYPWFPDGHISFLQDGEQYQMYWTGSTSYRTLGQDVSTMKSPAIAVLSKGEKGEIDNGGAWLMSVFRQTENELIGFYHAEDHEFVGDPSSKDVAWKSICLCTSSDNGITWTKQGQIIKSSTPKPEEPTWGGNGDICVVWDSENSRWVCFYQEHFLMTAITNDKNGAPGTWYKYYNGEFSEEGLGGKNSPIPSLKNHPGGNPSVHFNSYLDRWVMVWHTWEGHSPHPESIWLSTSIDLLDWTSPKPLVTAESHERIWYATIIGESDVFANQKAMLYYAYWPDKNDWEREFIQRSIQFGESASIQTKPAEVNEAYYLESAYPNPFNSSTLLRYSLKKADFVSITIFDINGKKIQTLVNEYQEAQNYKVRFDAIDFPSGLYICKLNVGDTFTQSRRMVLLK